MMVKIGFEPEPTKGFFSKIKLERGKGTYDKQKYDHHNSAGPSIINKFVRDDSLRTFYQVIVA